MLRFFGCRSYIHSCLGGVDRERCNIWRERGSLYYFRKRRVFLALNRGRRGRVARLWRVALYEAVVVELVSLMAELPYEVAKVGVLVSGKVGSPLSLLLCVFLKYLEEFAVVLYLLELTWQYVSVVLVA